MGLENTITEQEMDAVAQQFVQDIGNDSREIQPNLVVDGLSESIVSRFIGLITFRRS